MKSRIAVIFLCLGLSAIFAPTSAFAGNCKGVKFNFDNNRSTKVKIDKVLVEGKGKGGKWSQDISNKVVFAGESYTTDKLRFSKMDTGAAGTFRVKFLWFDASTGRWGGSRTVKGQTLRCDDNMTIRFELN